MTNTQKILDEFILDVKKYEKAADEGDNVLADKLNEKLSNLRDKLRAAKQDSIFSLLLDDKDENVRLWAAIFSLNFSPDEAEKVLIDLTKLPTPTSLMAGHVLTLWKQGIIK